MELTGLGGLVSNAHKVLVQDALLETFLQHGKTRKAGASTVLASGDEDAADQLPLSYRPRWDARPRGSSWSPWNPCPHHRLLFGPGEGSVTQLQPISH